MSELEWRLKAEITRHGYTTIAEFGLALQQHIDISRAAVYRLTRRKPALLKWGVLHGLCVTLSCHPADLIVLRRDAGRKATTRQLPPRLILP
jgi:DNA-binding Xre family transcriptional regulator